MGKCWHIESAERVRTPVFQLLPAEERTTDAPKDEKHRYRNEVGPNLTQYIEHLINTSCECTVKKVFKCACSNNHMKTI